MSTEKPKDHQSPEAQREALYKVQIDKAIYELKDPTPTGRELLKLAGKHLVDQFAIYEKPHGGGQPRRIQLDQQVDLRTPGVERFVTLPLDQTEGLGTRRDFSLPADDLRWLDDSGLKYELVTEGGILRVVLYDLTLPFGYNVQKANVNVRIDPGYPDAQIDMAYFFPPLAKMDGKPIGAICDDPFDGKSWQRWSRHRTTANPWRPGVDSLATHFALVESWLLRELTKA